METINNTTVGDWFNSLTKENKRDLIKAFAKKHQYDGDLRTNVYAYLNEDITIEFSEASVVFGRKAEQFKEYIATCKGADDNG
jgi:hypothetical protein